MRQVYIVMKDNQPVAAYYGKAGEGLACRQAIQMAPCDVYELPLNESDPEIMKMHIQRAVKQEPLREPKL